MDDILDDQSDLPSVELTQPMVDGTFLPEDIGRAFAQGHAAHVPYLAGSNSNESTLMPLLHMTPEDFAKNLGDKAPFIRKIYEENGAISDETFGRQLFADALFASAAQALSAFDTKAGEPAYVYHFAYVAEKLRADTPGVGHGGEIRLFSARADCLPQWRRR